MRYKEYLRHRYRAIAGYTGLLGLIAGLLVLSPLALLVPYPGEAALAWAFFLPGRHHCPIGRARAVAH